jgi:hypothetical protein
MLRALGKINPTPGVPIQVISLLPAATYPEKIHGVMVQARRANVGYAFVGNNLMNPVLDMGLFATLAVPTRNSIPSFTAALTLASNAITLNDLWIDVETLGDGVIVSVLIA